MNIESLRRGRPLWIRSIPAIASLTLLIIVPLWGCTDEVADIDRVQPHYLKKNQPRGGLVCSADCC